MREIKFRGREESGHWCYGDVTFTESKERAHIRIRAAGYYPNVEVAPATVGQYTGLKDADGREIYEGDVIRICGSNGIVAYGEGEFIVRFEKAPSLLSHCVGGDFSNPERVTACRVIGNIHDNPELISKCFLKKCGF